MGWYKKAQSFESMRDMSEWISTFDGQMQQYLAGLHAMKTRNKMGGLDGYAYPTLEFFFLEHGKMFESNEFTEDEMELIGKASMVIGDMQMKQCFYNAQTLALFRPQFKYVEGFLISGFIPVMHGWNTLNGKVIDFTMYHANNNKPILGIIPGGWEYFGVEMQTPKIRELWSTHETSMPLVDNHLTRWDMLKTRYNPEGEEQNEDAQNNEGPAEQDDSRSSVESR